MLDKLIYRNIREGCKNTCINFTSSRVPLNLIQHSSKIGKVLGYKFSNDFLIVLNLFLIEDKPQPFKEIPCELYSLLSFDCEVDDCTTGVKRFNNFVLVVAGEDESTVVIKCLNIRP